jgi:hypothetical protein
VEWGRQCLQAAFQAACEPEQTTHAGGTYSLRLRVSQTSCSEGRENRAESRGRPLGTGIGEALYGNTLRLRYRGLDAAAHYKVRFVEAGDATPHSSRLVANGKWEIHPMRKKDLDVRPMSSTYPPKPLPKVV